jgi:colanic acid/amylovoran biosynthesis glycosyltransferase
MRSVRRIAYLVSEYPAVNHTYLLREIRELRDLGWEVQVASIRPDTRPVSNLTTEEREERSSTWVLKPQGVGAAFLAHLGTFTTSLSAYAAGVLYAFRLGGGCFAKTFRNLLYFTEALMAGRWMQNHGLNHMHVHFASTVGLFVEKVFPVTISITIHGPAEFEEVSNFYLRDKIEAALCVCAISSFGRSQLMKIAPPSQWHKIALLPLGINPDRFTPSDVPKSHSSMFDVISVARLSSVKAQQILIDAIAKLVREGRQVRLRLVGDGPDRKRLENYISDCNLSDNIILEGALNQNQLRILYQESDAFALPSFAEGLPIVLMEAMAMEIPCVATWIAGIPELIQDGVNGLLVAPSDVDQLSAAIRRLMDDPDLRRRLAVAGRRKVIETYSLSVNTKRLARVLEKLMTGERHLRND